MTAKQDEVWEKVNELLKEHFDHYIIVMDTEAPDCLDRLFNAEWHGGLTVAIGLVARAEHRLKCKSEVSDI